MTTTKPIPALHSGVRTLRLLESLTRSAIIKSLKGLTYGQLRMTEGDQVWTFGTLREGEPSAVILVKNARTWDRVAFGGTVGAAESYMDGDWSSDNLVDVIRIFCGNRDTMNGMEGGLALLKWPALKLYHFMRRDTIEGAQKNIADHYDLGDEFFKAWLDSSMAYSSGVFPNSESTMLSASIHKIQKLCEKLDLQPTDHLLEIGSGWGAMALHAATNYGCKVTTVTISKNQYDCVQAEVQRLGLENKIEVVFCDYRKITGEFDKIVSIEMIEAVGHEYMDTYFNKVSTLLKPTGRAVIQAITIRDQFYDQAIRNVDFIQRYIFPGSTIPSVTRMMDAVRDSTDMIMEGLEDYTSHYAKTIHNWRDNFWKKESYLKSLGCTDHMLRMWDYYFAYCEGGFSERVIGVVQMTFTKPRHHTLKNRKADHA